MKNRKRFKNWQFPEIIDRTITEYGWAVWYSKKFNIGRFTDIGFGTFINSKYGVEIEEDVQIGSHCSIYSENTINGTKGKVRICKGARIGSHCLILPNTTIEENVLVKSYSIVKNKNGVTKIFTPNFNEEFMNEVSWLR